MAHTLIMPSNFLRAIIFLLIFGNKALKLCVEFHKIFILQVFRIGGTDAAALINFRFYDTELSAYAKFVCIYKKSSAELSAKNGTFGGGRFISLFSDFRFRISGLNSVAGCQLSVVQFCMPSCSANERRKAHSRPKAQV
jgi:hypothetical protein